jgi:hypothetical protein
MMSITHVMVGMLLAIPVAVVAPEFALAAATGGLLGGVVPDLDLFVGVHRRTLHFPVAGPAIGGGACLVAVASPSTVTVGAAVFLLSAGLHASTDVLGAGEELRPWERTNPYAVYDHVRGRWLRARYLIRYDGAPEDLAVAVLLALPTLAVYDGNVRWLLVGLLGAGGVYALARKRLVVHFERLLE